MSLLPGPQLWATLGPQHWLSHLVEPKKRKANPFAPDREAMRTSSASLPPAHCTQPTCPSCCSSLWAPFPPTTSPSVSVEHNTKLAAGIFIINPPKKTKRSLEEGLSLTNRSQLGAGVVARPTSLRALLNLRALSAVSEAWSETLMSCCAWALTALGCAQPPGQLELSSWLQRPVSLPSWQALLLQCGLSTDLSHVINSVLFKVGGFVGWHQDGDNYLASRQEMTSYWQ